MSNRKEFIYFPSLSSGNSRAWYLKNLEVAPDVTSRFYSKDHPKAWRFPYFLLSAGHAYKVKDLRTQMGMEDTFVIGDSGGYQIAYGALKWKPELRQVILEWLENNSDIAMNLDIPPRAQYASKFEESLQLSKENFKYFEEHRTGGTQFLNVLQGNNERSYTQWYNGVKGFDFNGWSLGGTYGIGTSVMYALALLLDAKEFEQERNRYFHILGASGVGDFLFLAVLQNLFNKKFDNRVQISTDSSSPNRATLFGTYYFDINWKTLSWISTYFGKEGKTDYLLDEKLPCNLDCPACIDKTYQDIAPYDDKTYMIMTTHNLYLYARLTKIATKLAESHSDLMKELVPKDYKLLFASMKEMFESEHPLRVYEKYKHLYLSFKDNELVVPDHDKINKFFNVL